MSAINRPHRDDQIQMAQLFGIRVKQIRAEVGKLHRNMHEYLDTSMVCSDVHSSISDLMAGLDDVDTDIDKALQDSCVSNYRSSEEELAQELESKKENIHREQVYQDYYASVL